MHHFTRCHIHYNRYIPFHQFPWTFDEFIFRYIELFMDSSLDLMGYLPPTAYTLNYSNKKILTLRCYKNLLCKNKKVRFIVTAPSHVPLAIKTYMSFLQIWCAYFYWKGFSSCWKLLITREIRFLWRLFSDRPAEWYLLWSGLPGITHTHNIWWK